MEGDERKKIVIYLISNAFSKNEKVESIFSNIEDAVKELNQKVSNEWKIRVVGQQIYVHKEYEGKNYFVKFYFNELGCYFYESFSLLIKEKNCFYCGTDNIVNESKQMCSNCHRLDTIDKLRIGENIW